ncbi:MAG: hypothetical protein ACHP9Z_23325 [Streptosporangiales bacterium]
MRRTAMASVAVGLGLLGAAAGVIIARPGGPGGGGAFQLAGASGPSGARTHLLGTGVSARRLPVSAPASGHGPMPSGGISIAAHAAGFGYPAATNTGATGALTAVPGSVTRGPGWSYANGVISVTGAGARLARISTSAEIQVDAPHVTIDNVRVVAALTNDPGIALEQRANGTTIENSTIAGTNSTGGTMLVGIKDVHGTPVTGTVIDRCNIYNTSSGVQIYAGTIENSYIHALGNNGREHLEDINDTGNSGHPLFILHNTLFNPGRQTAAIYLSEDYSAEANVTVNNNILGGGDYSFYGGNTGAAAPIPGRPAHISFTNNIFSRLRFRNGGYFGPVAHWLNGNGNVWAGNVWDVSGQIVRPS